MRQWAPEHRLRGHPVDHCFGRLCSRYLVTLQFFLLHNYVILFLGSQLLSFWANWMFVSLFFVFIYLSHHSVFLCQFASAVVIVLCVLFFLYHIFPSQELLTVQKLHICTKTPLRRYYAAALNIFIVSIKGWQCWIRVECLNKHLSPTGSVLVQSGMVSDESVPLVLPHDAGPVLQVSRQRAVPAGGRKDSWGGTNTNEAETPPELHKE